MNAISAEALQDYPATSGSLDIEENPFWRLGITPRDSAQRIVEAAAEKSISLDPDSCSKARSDLTHPRKRITAEVSWLPGLSPNKAMEAISLLHLAPEAILERDGDAPLTLANLMASAFTLLDAELPAAEWARWICRFAETSDAIKAGDVLRDINEDRIAASMTPVRSEELIEEEIANRKRAFKDSVLRGVDKLQSLKLVEVITLAVDQATGSGSHHAPSLVDDLVDSYELKAKEFLRQEAGNILKLVERARARAPQGALAVRPIVERLDELTRRWDKVAQPVQLSKKSRGMGHDMSHELAGEIRNLSVDLVNEQGMLEVAKKLFATLKDVFAELPELMHRFDDDTKTLEGLFERRALSEKELEEWKEGIRFSAEIGVVFRNTLSLSHEGIRWKNDLFPLESISRVRWGATRHSVNGIPTGTSYHIWFGDNRRLVYVDPRQEQVFQSFIQKLWQAVCVRLVMELITGLAKGTHHRFGDAIVSDDSVEMIRHRLFSHRERVSLPWSKIQIWNQEGCLYLGSTDDKKVYSTLSYQDVDNVHILEAVIRAFYKKGGASISGAFGLE